ncbi:MAG: PEGA domain-containing protein [Deltaproteobacteria bacterium]|nr:PEGA domain-containing protein [Deltaproteobacteria bacterium]
MGAGRFGSSRHWFWGAILACTASARPAAADPIVLGEGEGTVRELEARGHRAVGPDDARADLGRRAGAAPDPAPIRALAAQGRAAYAQTDFPAAIEALRQASAAAFAAGPDALPRGELAAIHLDLGIAELARGWRGEAEIEVALALRLDPAVAVDRSLHGPPVWRMVERVRASTPRPVARILVTEPEGGTIRLDARDASPSPFSVADLTLGPHVVVVRRPGHPPAMVRIDVTEATVSPVAIRLPPESGAAAARGALDALDAGDLERAATLARVALDADGVLAVAPEAGRLRAVWAPRGAPPRSISAASPSELASTLFPQPSVRLAIRTPRRPSPHVARDPEPRPSAGLPWWAWAGGGALVAGAATAAVIFLARPDKPPTEHLLVGELVP